LLIVEVSDVGTGLSGFNTCESSSCTSHFCVCI